MNQAVADENRRAGLRAGWTREVAATLTLAWPMILSNLAGTALATMDLVLIGRLGPEPLAAAALATNLFHAVLISAIGLVTAVSPLVAAEYGRCRHSVRDIRRSVRQGLWVAAAICAPAWVLLSQGETVLQTFGQEPKLAAAAGEYLQACNGRCCRTSLSWSCACSWQRSAVQAGVLQSAFSGYP
jgi:MATE family multidrug resistance protein